MEISSDAKSCSSRGSFRPRQLGDVCFRHVQDRRFDHGVEAVKTDQNSTGGFEGVTRIFQAENALDFVVNVPGRLLPLGR